jgi:glycine oxidase
MADCGVAVVGAGVIGAAIGYELLMRGASVTVIDARGAGLGSTQAAAGMLVPFIEGAGRPLLPFAIKSLQMYGEFADRLTRDTGLGTGYTLSGSLQIATDDEGAEELRSVAASVTAAGVTCELLEGSAVRNAEPLLTPDAQAGLFIHHHGFVVPLDLLGALSAGLIKRGARVIVPSRVRRIVPRHTDVEIIFESGDRMTAEHVVLAAGSWAGHIEIDGAPSVPIRPVRGQLLQLTWDAEPMRRLIWGPNCYLVPATAKTLLVGATVEDAGFDERNTVAAVHDLLDAAADLVPQVWKSSLIGVRVGLRPAAPDDMPLIGRFENITRVVVAAGHFRNGVLLAPWTAKVVADLLLTGREDPLLAQVSPQRFVERTHADTF